MIPGVTPDQRKKGRGVKLGFFNLNFWNTYVIFRFIASWMMHKFCYLDNPFKS